MVHVFIIYMLVSAVQVTYKYDHQNSINIYGNFVQTGKR